MKKDWAFLAGNEPTLSGDLDGEKNRYFSAENRVDIMQYF